MSDLIYREDAIASIKRYARLRKMDQLNLQFSLYEIINLLKKVPPSDDKKWIPMSSGKLPENDEEVLVTLEEGTDLGHSIVVDRFVELCHYVDDGDGKTCCGVKGPHFHSANAMIKTDDVVAWIPKPEPYAAGASYHV